MRTRIVAVGMLLLVTACDGYKATGASTNPIASVTVTGLTTGLVIGQTAQLSVSAADGSGGSIANPGTVTWTSSTPTVATVDQTGKVTAVATGNAIVTATAGGVSGTLTVRVNATGS